MALEHIHPKFVRLMNQQYLQIGVAMLPTASWGNFTCLSTQGSGLLLRGAFAANEDKMTRMSRIPCSIVPLARHLAKRCATQLTQPPTENL